MRVRIEITTYTEPGHDKKVRVGIELPASDSIIDSREIPSIDAEEKKDAYGHSVVMVPRDKWPQEGVPRLRLTLSAVDD